MPDRTLPAETAACRIAVRGIVQGVGFRPFVATVAARHRVYGWVLNSAAGVEIHAEATSDDLNAFLEELGASPPSAAQVTRIDVCETPLERFSDFQIRESCGIAPPSTRICPDLMVCDECLVELLDPANRRHRYPYINCTCCGPRYSLLQRLPYDRPNTTMSEWPLCDRCLREYRDPRNRRFHAQPTACAVCGPGYHLIQPGSPPINGDLAISRAAELLCQGQIVAVKGIGGYHLACDARNVFAVTALRERKSRGEQPFAVMVSTIDEARDLVKCSPAHERLLLANARPIVIAPARIELPGVAPGNRSLGVMLPYAPVHHLMFADGAPVPLVLTSANRSNEPIAYRDDVVRAQLEGIADAFLIGDRPITRRVDDSVVTVRRDQPFLIRRSRGYSPATVCSLPTSAPILAVGSDLKNTIALVVQGDVIVSQHIGDLGDWEASQSFETTIRDLLGMYSLRMEDLVVIHDLHPQFHSTRFAQSLPCLKQIAIQHHHAHIASVMAEHEQFDETVVGVAFDGTGYGTDGTIWGGEFFVGSIQRGFDRVASLKPVKMPGGDAAARLPVQAAAGFLASIPNLPDLTRPPFLFPRRFTDAVQLVTKDVRCTISTSMGRLFDAAAALLGFVDEISFEGQAAIWLEHQAQQSPDQTPYLFPDLDPAPLLLALIQDRLNGREISEIANAFHAAIATATAREIERICRQRELRTVALSGGVFQNEILLNQLVGELERLLAPRILINRMVPANDGGICVGQAALGSFQFAGIRSG